MALVRALSIVGLSAVIVFKKTGLTLEVCEAMLRLDCVPKSDSHDMTVVAARSCNDGGPV